MVIVLLIERGDLRENLSELLEMEGYTVILVANLNELNRMYHQISPDLLICDALRTQKGGITFYEQDGGILPMVVLNAEGEPTREWPMADLYLQLPLNIYELLDAVEAFSSNPDAKSYPAYPA